MSRYQKNSLGHLTGLASRLFNRLLTQRFKQQGIDLSAEQWGVIVTLLNHPESSQNEICDLLYLEKSSVSRSIAGLERKGWVQRKRSSKDNRSKVVTLTAQSLSLVEQCSTIAASVLADAESNNNAAELNVTKNNLASVVEQLRQLNQS